MRVPATMSTSARVAVAVPDSVCRKFSAVRSPVTMLRAGPRSSQTTESAAICDAVGRVPVDGDSRIELPKRLVEPSAAAQRRGLACDDARDRVRLRRDQLGREIAVAEVLRDRAAHDGRDIGWQSGRWHRGSRS